MTENETEMAAAESTKPAKSKDEKRSRLRRNRALKVVIRCLPPSMTEEDFLEHVAPLPDYESFYFVPAESSMGGLSFSRAYIAFRGQEEVVSFHEKWDGYVFLDERGQDYPGIVEFAPFQKMPRKKPKKADYKSGTLENDAEYLKFVETMDVEEEVELPSLEVTVEELERRDRELRANNGVPKVVTPLIEFVLAKKMEKLRMRDEKREERKKKDAERKRARDTDKKRNKRDGAPRVMRESTIREESDEDAMSLDDDSSYRVEFRPRDLQLAGAGYGALRPDDLDRPVPRTNAVSSGDNNRDRMAGPLGAGVGGDRLGEAAREKTGRRERNRNRGNKDNNNNNNNKKGQPTKGQPGGGNQLNGGQYHVLDSINNYSNNHRGMLDDVELRGISPVFGRQGGVRDRADRDRDHREDVDRHAKYYDEPKATNHRRNARLQDGDGDVYEREDQTRPLRREKKGRHARQDGERERDKDRPKDKARIAGDGVNRAHDRKRNDRDDRRDRERDQQQIRDQDEPRADDRGDSSRLEKEIRRPGCDKDERGADRRPGARDSHRESPDNKEERGGGGGGGGGARVSGDRDDRDDRDRERRGDHRRNDKGDHNQRKANQRDRNNRNKRDDREAEFREVASGGASGCGGGGGITGSGAGSGAAAAGPTILGAGGGGHKGRQGKGGGGGGGAGGRGGDRREDRGPPPAKREQPRPVSKRYSDTRPAPLGKPKFSLADGDAAFAEEGPSRLRTDYDESSGDPRETESAFNGEPSEIRPVPRPQRDDGGGGGGGGRRMRNKFRPAIEIYKPGNARRKSDRDVKSTSPDVPQ